MALPLWKLGREVRRVAKQLPDWPGDLYDYLFATWVYEHTHKQDVRCFEGKRAASDRVAIFVIFPKDGLQASHLRAFDYFNERNYAVLAISNVPLTEADRAKLLDHTWKYMERPNFGYDFGAYRDGILTLADHLDKLKRLVLFNDSTWFPLPGSRDWLDDVENLGVDFAGAASNYGTPRPDVGQFHEMTWFYSSEHRNFHYCSFALCMRPNVFRNPGFLKFWKGLRLTDKKKRTVRRGEIGFSQWMLRQGFTHGATLDITHLDRDLAALGDKRLIEVARGLIIQADPKLRQLQARVTAEKEPSRTALINLILVTVSRQGASYALAPFAVHERGFPFLKKSPLWLNPDSAQASLGLLDTLGGPDRDLIQAEARILALGREV